MKQVSQIDAVITAITNILGSSFVPNTTVVSEIITKQQKNIVRDQVIAGIRNGTVAYKKDPSNERELMRYVSGMVNHHITRSKKLNGNKAHAAKIKRPKVFSQDSTLKELTAYLKIQPHGSAEYTRALAAIEKRKSELLQLKKEIDISIAPQEVIKILNQKDL